MPSSTRRKSIRHAISADFPFYLSTIIVEEGGSMLTRHFRTETRVGNSSPIENSRWQSGATRRARAGTNLRLESDRIPESPFSKMTQDCSLSILKHYRRLYVCPPAAAKDSEANIIIARPTDLLLFGLYWCRNWVDIYTIWVESIRKTLFTIY